MRPLDARVSSSLVGKPSFSLANRCYRALWAVAWGLFAAWTPPPLHKWRRLLLVAFGARVDRSARVYGSARVWHPKNLEMGAHAVLGPRVTCYCMGQIIVQEMAVISQGAHLCAGTHDIRDANFQLVTKPIVISTGAWVAAEAFIGPGVTVGEGAVIGARAVVFKDTEAFGVYVGNPARWIKQREVPKS